MTSDPSPFLARLREATAGQYEIVRELGRGGMAVVYLAYEIALDRHVAIKALLSDEDGDGSASRRFLQEARTAARLSHPNVVRVHAVAPDGASVRWFTMQYVDGCSLEELLRASGPLPIPVACHLLAQIVSGLRYAHGHERGGVVHRDVKPANVMLDREGRAVLTDFGIARIAGADGAPRDAAPLGTPEYMSPEQWREDAATPASDQYSLGAIAYRMLAGAPPFEGDAFAAPGGRRPPRPVGALRADCPPRLESIVARMLARSADARYPSLDAVWRELLPLVPPPDSVGELPELIARAASAASTPVAVAEPVERAETTGEGAPPTVQLPPPRRRRRRVLAGAGAVAAAGLVALAARGRDPHATVPVAVAPRASVPTRPAEPAPPPSPAPVEVGGETVAPGRPARVLLVGLPAGGRLRQGDSVRVRARVLDAHGARMAAASVVLASSDSTRLAIRRHRGGSWVVARAAGSAPVRITARSGDVAVRRSIRVVGRVAGRAAGAVAGKGVGRAAPSVERSEAARLPDDSAARPGAAALDAAIASLLADISARGRAAFDGVLAGDDASTRDFLAWAAGARRLRVRESSHEPPVLGRGGATVDLALVLTWHRGLRRDPARTVRFRAAFVPDGRWWRLDHLQLREPSAAR